MQDAADVVPKDLSALVIRLSSTYYGFVNKPFLPAERNFPTRAAAYEWLLDNEAKIRPHLSKVKIRPCLCCKRAFESEGPHNRLCCTCRLKSESSPYEIGSRR